MVEIKDLFHNNEKIKIIVEDNDYRDFLQYAKTNGCLWDDGRIINPKLDKPDSSTNLVVITKNKLIHHPHGYIALMALQNKPKYYFKDIKKDIVIDINFEEKRNLRKSIENKENALEEAKANFEKHLEHQRELSTKQLKYHKYTSTLPKHFYVQYKDIKVCIDLFSALDKYGYENVYEVNPLFLKDETKLILINNNEMKFYPLNTKEYSFVALSKQKIYEADKMIEILESIFQKG